MISMNRSSLRLAFVLCVGTTHLVMAADQAPATVQLPARDLDKKFLVAIAPVNPDGTVNVVVDQAAAKDKKGGRAVPVGRIPRSILAKEKGGTGEALQAYLLGSTAPVGATDRGRALALITRSQSGKEETRVVVVPLDGLYGPYTSLEQISKVAPGILAELKAGFGSTKDGATFTQSGRKETIQMLGDAISTFEVLLVKDADKRPLDKDGNPMLYKWSGARNIGE